MCLKRGILGKDTSCAFPRKKTGVGLAKPDNLNKFRGEELSPGACRASSSPGIVGAELWLSPGET